MRFRKFMARLLGFRVPPGREQPARQPPADPLWQASQDALTLLDAIYTGHPWSRRAMAGKMSQPRWANAVQILRSAEILDPRWRRVSLEHDYTAARARVHEVVRLERAKRSNSRYVSPW